MLNTMGPHIFAQEAVGKSMVPPTVNGILESGFLGDHGGALLLAKGSRPPMDIWGPDQVRGPVEL